MSKEYPIATHIKFSVGDHTWNAFRGHNGNNYVYSFLRTSNSYSVSFKYLLASGCQLQEAFGSCELAVSCEFLRLLLISDNRL
jgi:hypothetical protein